CAREYYYGTNYYFDYW
nr:immunoglobulin heavy chain junction region [Mus musculus]MBK4195428.1 immunoglobulin heavy chain junction region [Mus musculus]MBK4195439.1 immunoglobulin heavy chain junction region [Mus musculus]